MTHVHKYLCTVVHNYGTMTALALQEDITNRRIGRITKTRYCLGFSQLSLSCAMQVGCDGSIYMMHIYILNVPTLAEALLEGMHITHLAYQIYLSS